MCAPAPNCGGDQRAASRAPDAGRVRRFRNEGPPAEVVGARHLHALRGKLMVAPNCGGGGGRFGVGRGSGGQFRDVNFDSSVLGNVSGPLKLLCGSTPLSCAPLLVCVDRLLVTQVPICLCSVLMVV